MRDTRRPCSNNVSQSHMGSIQINKPIVALLCMPCNRIFMMQSSEIGASDGNIARLDCLAALHYWYAHYRLPTIRVWQLVQLRTIWANYHIIRIVIGEVDGTARKGK